MESKLCCTVAKEPKIQEKLGSIKTEFATLEMSARKFKDTIQLHGTTTWNNLLIELEIILFNEIPMDFEKQMKAGKLELHTRKRAQPIFNQAGISYFMDF